jgi:hypothetical protein
MAEDFVRYGLPGLFGFNLKGSLSIVITDLPATLGDLLGAPWSVISDTWQGVRSMARGDWSKGFEKVLPLAAGAPIKAYREHGEGLTSRSNAPIFYGNKPVVADTVDSIYRLLSFNPAGIAKVREKIWSSKKLEMKYSELRNDIYAKFKKYALLPPHKRTRAKYIDLLAEVREYNQRVIDNGLQRKGIILLTPKRIKANVRRAMKPGKRERLRARRMAAND